jgi:hypothetical protein
LDKEIPFASRFLEPVGKFLWTRELTDGGRGRPISPTDE